jgi:sigma-E factor negative regulatory protein RseA
MNEQLRDQISAFLDDELPPGESELLVRRIARDPAIHRTASRYLLIGQTLRGETSGDPLAFMRMLNLRIHAGEDEMAEPLDDAPIAPLPGRTTRWWRPASGAAAAAAVALIAIVGLQNVTREEGMEPAATATITPAAAPARASADAGALPPLQTTQLPIRLTNYLMSHGEVTGTLGRKTIHSGIVGTSAAHVMSGYSDVRALEGIYEPTVGDDDGDRAVD